MDLTAREQATARMFDALYAEIIPFVPDALWDQLTPGGLIERADLALRDAAAGYERGEGSRDDVLAAAEQLRASWRQALDRAGSPCTR